MSVRQVKGQLPSDSVQMSQDSLKISRMKVAQNRQSSLYPEQTPRVIPPTPQSQLFQKYMDYPVTEYNGLPQIEIPLYEVKIKGLTIPISLSYHAGGIKYMEYDGDVGAGWNIGAGGYRVIRTISGKPDEKSNFYDEQTLSRAGNPSWERDYYLAGMLLNGQEATQTVNRSIDPAYICDGLYDLFSYQLPSTQGYFIINDRVNKQVDVLGRNRDKISLSNGSSLFQNMSIVDTEGIKYIFGENGLNEQTLLDSYIEETSWPLTRISSLFNEEVIFKYKMIHVIHPVMRNTLYVQSAPTGIWKSSGVVEAQFFVDGHTYSSELKFYSLFVDEIITDNEIIKFNRQSGLNREHIINSITVTNKRENKQILNIAFSYMQNLNSRGLLHLLLDKITVNCSDNLVPPQEYSFKYYLPEWGDKLLAYPDQWGYYKSYTTDIGGFAALHSESNNIAYVRQSNCNKAIPRDLEPVANIMDNLYWLPRTSGDPVPNYYSLKRITYPTGGYKDFEYESHRIKHDNKLIYGGGLRIKKTISSTGTDENVTAIYKYGINENGEGKPNIPINIYKDLFVDSYVYVCDADAAYSGGSNLLTYPTLIIGEKPLVSEAFDFKVNYDCVTKYEQTGNMDNGKTVSFYKISTDYDVLGYNGGIITMENIDFFPLEYSRIGELDVNKRKVGVYPTISRQIKYDSSGKKVAQKDFSYATLDIKKYVGQKVKRRIIGCPDNNKSLGYEPSCYGYVNSQFGDMPYFIDYYTQLISSEKNIMYSYKNEMLVDSVKQVEMYEYDSKNRIKKTIQTNSVNGNYVKELTYPSGNTGLVNRNMLSTVLETVTTHNGKEIGRVKNIYPDNAILPSSVQTSASGIGNLRTDVIYDIYDAKGNMQQYTTLDSIATTYLWGYGGQYPIAEIKNATYATVVQALGRALVDRVSSALVPSEYDLKALKDLRKNTTILKDALVTVYTYKPLVGILTVTDPSGITTYYDYDAFGRLKETYIKNDNGNKQVIQNYVYHYQNQ
jgi:YD repeat-containing protein